VATILEKINNVWRGWVYGVGILYVVFERYMVFETPEVS
jgi:hypothetical protein